MHTKWETDGFSSWLQSFVQQWSLKLKSLKWNDSQTDRKQSYIQTLPWGHWGHWWVLWKSTGRWQERSNDGFLLLSARAGPPRALSVWPLTSAPLMSELKHMFNDSVCTALIEEICHLTNHLSFALNPYMTLGVKLGGKGEDFFANLLTWGLELLGRMLNKAWLIPV